MNPDITLVLTETGLNDGVHLSSLEQVPGSRISSIEPVRVAGAEIVNDEREWHLVHFYCQMHMVSHPTIGVDPVTESPHTVLNQLLESNLVASMLEE